jgi:hypothetical protein
MHDGGRQGKRSAFGRFPAPGRRASGDDLVVVNPNPTAGAHGFLSTEREMNALFVASGACIKSGKRLATVENIDVAPTIARLLGVSLKDASGRVLEEILHTESGR